MNARTAEDAVCGRVRRGVLSRFVKQGICLAGTGMIRSILGPAIAMHSFLNVMAMLPLKVFLSLVRHAEQLQRIRQQILLNLKIDARIGAETWRMIYLYEPRLQLLVDEDVEAEDLEALRVQGLLLVSAVPQAIIYVLCLVWYLQIMLQRGLHSAKSPNYDLLDLQHHPFRLPFAVFKVLTDPLQDRGEGALVAGVDLLEILIELEDALVLRIDGIVGQMHEQIRQVLLAWRLVGLCAESGEAFLE